MRRDRGGLPTVYWPEDGDDADEWPLCEVCYTEVKDEVLIVPGPYYAWGFCNDHQGWCSMNDLKEWVGGGPHGAPQGSCIACARGAG